MTVYKPIEWEIWTISRVAAFPIEAHADPVTCTDLITAVRFARPVYTSEGALVLTAALVDGVWIADGETPRAIKAMIHGAPCLWLELVDDAELGTSQGVVSMDPTPTAARTPALAGGSALEREAERLKGNGHNELVPVLHHYAQRWQDYKIPVWKSPA